MLQDVFPEKLDNHYKPDIVPGADSLVISYNENNDILLNVDEKEETISFPEVSDFVNLGKEDLVYLFNVGNKDFFLLMDEKKTENLISSQTDKPDGNDEKQPVYFFYTKLSELRAKYLYPKHYVFAAMTAYQLNEWYQTTKFCGKCGSPNENDKTERARVCPKCGNKIYPRINPACIIGVTDKETNRIILTKYRTGFRHNALVAGFTEIGETLEETVEREVMEEVGLKVKNIRYYKSQPWAIASDILAGFFCDVDGSTEINMDESELRYAEWVAPEDIELQPIDYSLTNEMMRLFKEKGYQGTI